MSVYADTSWIVSLYAGDANTEQALQQARNLGSPLFLTEWQEFEFASALSGRIFRKEMTTEDRERCLEDLERDVSRGLFVRTSLPLPRIVRDAKSLALRWTPETGCRAYDIFHVAQGVFLKAERFASFDPRQNLLAKKSGLRLI